MIEKTFDITKYNFDINIFNKEFENGEYFAIDYINNTVIKKLNCNFNEFKNIPLENKKQYLFSMFSSLSLLNECLLLYENYNFENKFEYDIYFNLRNKFFNELGLIYNDNTEKWEIIPINYLYHINGDGFEIPSKYKEKKLTIEDLKEVYKTEIIECIYNNKNNEIMQMLWGKELIKLVNNKISNNAIIKNLEDMNYIIEKVEHIKGVE